MDGVGDEALVRRVAGGDGRALGGLYGRYAGLVYGTGRRYLGDRRLAEDLVQDVFAAVWRNVGSFDASWASFSTWVYRATRNRATGLIRRREARVKTVDGDSMPEPNEADPSGQLPPHRRPARHGQEPDLRRPARSHAPEGETHR